MQRGVARTFLSAGSRDFPVPCFHAGTGDWKVARTRRLESLRYRGGVIQFRISGSNQLANPCAPVKKKGALAGAFVCEIEITA